MPETVIIEDCIMQKRKPAKAGLKILEGFIAPFSASAVERLENAGFEITGRADANEIGTGGFSQEQPYGGSAAVSAVSNGEAGLALINDYSGVARRCAPQKGVCVIHPTYGTVSRYGLIPAVSSMDVIGVVCKDIEAGFKLLSVIAGKDERDGAMFPDKSYEYRPQNGNIRLGVPKNAADSSVYEFSKKFDTVDIELKYFDVYKQVLDILSAAEICNNISRYDGIKFGYRAENFRGLNSLYVNSRTEALGLSAKLAALAGSIVLSEENYSRYYEKALKIRRLIKESLEFDKYDVIALPAHAGALAALAGLPAVSFNYNGEGVQLMSAPKNENAIYGVWLAAKEAGK